jgi:HlyD family secretion protein
MEVEEYRVSGKVPGRILALLAKEGDFVHAGDTLAIIEAPEVNAKMVQAQSAADAATAIAQMTQNGARNEQIQAAAQILEQAKAGLEIAEKSYNRMKKLHEEEVISAQKFDEAEAMYKSAQAQVKTAQSNYQMAVNGARDEERRAAAATAGQARGAVQEVQGYVRETIQRAQMAGEVTDVYPKVGELVGTGTPIMSIATMDDQWATFNIREDQLKGMKVGQEITVRIPALDIEAKMKITSMKDKGSFAVWKSTKASGQYDQKTFEVKARPSQAIDGIRPGMSVILKNK